MSLVGELLERREMLKHLVLRELKSRYKGSALGFLWSILTPLFMAVIYVFFLRLLSRSVPVESIVIGVFAWQFTTQSVQSGMVAVTGNGNLVKKVFFPRTVLPISTTCAALVNYLLSLLVQFPLVWGLLLWRGQPISMLVILVPFVIALQFLLNMTLALLLSASNVYFRDTQHLVGVLISAWFFVSPVMYDLDMVRSLAGANSLIPNLYMLNPVAGLITLYRALILPSAHWDWNPWAMAGMLWPILLLPVATAVYKKAQRNFADML